MGVSGFTFKQLQETIEKHKNNIEVVPKMALYVSPKFWEEELKPQIQMPASRVFSSMNPFGINIYIDDGVETYEFREVKP